MSTGDQLAGLCPCIYDCGCQSNMAMMLQAGTQFDRDMPPLPADDARMVGWEEIG